MKILIADDSKVSRFMLKSILESGINSDCEFIFAKDGEEAVVFYLESRPDIAFFDLTMPKKSGVEALSEVMVADPDAKVVIITADTQKITHDRALKLGALDYINKPLSEEKIMRQLYLWL